MVWDIAVSEDGGMVAASVENFSSYKAAFFKSDGNMIGEFNLTEPSHRASMSGDGRRTAIGGGVINSLYMFKTIEDSTPPLIENVYQEPTNDTVTPDDKVKVYANVTDNESGVEQVTLNYCPDNETWFIVNMTNLEGNTWNGTIPTFDYCTWVNYTITAKDKVENTITSEEEVGYQHQYHVIPEFPSLMIIPLFIMATLLVTIIHKRKREPKRMLGLGLAR
jgi:hypothetical protein